MDAVSDISLSQMLNSLLSECIWGTLKPRTSSDDDNSIESGSKGIMRSTRKKVQSNDSVGGTTQGGNQSNVSSNSESSNFEQKISSINDWKICSTNPQIIPPEEGAMTFGEFVESQSLRLKMSKKEIKAYKTRFTEKGMAGETCFESFEKLQKCMRYSTETKFVDKYDGSGNNGRSLIDEETMGNIQNSIISENENQKTTLPEKEKGTIEKEENISIQSILQSESYHIIPSFFKLISYLHQEKVNFRLIFRTFGVDIERVAYEFNLYCEGNHPLFPLSSPPLSIAVDTDKSNILINNNVDDISSSIQRVKMDGSGVDGIDRRLYLPHYLGVLKRTSDHENGVSLQTINIEGVSTTKTFIHSSNFLYLIDRTLDSGA